MTTEPVSALRTPSVDHTYDDLLFALKFPDWITPSFWILKGLERVTGTNPVDWLMKEVVGDWEAFAQASSALDHLGQFHALAATAVREDAARLAGQWTGEAAAAAQAYFASLAEAVQSQEQPFADAQQACGEMASAVANLASAGGSILEMLIDKVVIWLVTEAAALAAFAAPGIGLPAALALAALATKQFVQALGLWKRLIEAHGTAVFAMTALVGSMTGVAGYLRQFELHPVPVGAYDNPLVP